MTLTFLELGLKFWPYILAAIGFFAALFWNQKQLKADVKMLKEQHEKIGEKMEKQNQSIGSVKTHIVKMEAEHSGVTALIQERFKSMEDKIDLLIKTVSK